MPGQQPNPPDSLIATATEPSRRQTLVHGANRRAYWRVMLCSGVRVYGCSGEFCEETWGYVSRHFPAAMRISHQANISEQFWVQVSSKCQTSSSTDAKFQDMYTSQKVGGCECRANCQVPTAKVMSSPRTTDGGLSWGGHSFFHRRVCTVCA